MSTQFHTRIVCLAIALCSAAAPTLASSTAASSASEGASASVGSASDSFETSSDGSSAGDKKAAAGDYQVIDVAAATGRPGMLRMQLQPVAQNKDGSAFALFLPEKALAENRVAAGQIVSAKARPYGTEFAAADTGRAFFLVVTDDFQRELQTKAVVL